MPSRLQLSRADIPNHLLGYFRPHEVIKPKDDVGIPWAVARALRADGWYLRSEVIWAKKNCMPESVTDRPTKSHEQLFLLAKQPRYYFDQDAIRESADEGSIAREGRARLTAYSAPGQSPNRRNGSDGEWQTAGRNRRSVWTIPTEPFPEAHFATYPQALVRPCIQAGTSEHGECSSCGAPWMRETSQRVNGQAHRSPKDRARHEAAVDSGSFDSSRLHNQYFDYQRETTSWRASCACDAPIRPQLVLDPFVGSGTTALVARNHGRRAIGVDLSDAYLQIAARRLQQLSLLS